MDNQAAYDVWSTFYDDYENPTVAIDEMHFPKFYSAFRRLNILEIGCGTGRHTIRLIENENWVTGVDPSGGMLARLKTKIQSPRLTLMNVDFLSAEIPNAPYDVLLESLVLEHISDLEAFFNKSAELLRAGGQLLMSEIHPSRTAQGILAHFRNPEGHETALASHAHTELEIAAAARDAGFIIKQTLSIHGDRALAKRLPKWARYEKKPMIQIWLMEK